MSGSVDAKVKRTVLLRPGRGSGQPGPCERCGHRVACDAHHRLLKSQLGRNVPSNLAALCRECHDWCHQHPAEAVLGGWIVPPHCIPARRALLLWDGMLVTLDDDGMYAFEGMLNVPV